MLKTWYKALQQRMAENKRSREVMTMCKRVVRYVTEKVDAGAEKQHIPGVDTYTFRLTLDDKTYVIVHDRLIRGDLYMLREESQENTVLLDFGDQTRQYGLFLGLCKDIIVDENFSPAELETILNNN